MNDDTLYQWLRVGSLMVIVTWCIMLMLVMSMFISACRADSLHLPMRYLIGADNPQGKSDHITVVPYDSGPVRQGISVAYVNMLDETNSGRYPPYLKPYGTSREYKEGLIDPHGSGFMRNLDDQFAQRKAQGFKYIELDNADSYGTGFTLIAIYMAQSYGFGVLAKNPVLLAIPSIHLSHPAVVGVIVEHGAGDPRRMDRLRADVNKPQLPVWFVSHGNTGLVWARSIANDARRLNMGVTHSQRGEYSTTADIVVPRW